MDTADGNYLPCPLVCGYPLGNDQDVAFTEAVGMGQDQSSWPGTNPGLRFIGPRPELCR